MILKDGTFTILYHKDIYWK